MAQTFTPETVDEVRAIVADALASGTPLEVAGEGSRRMFGRPVATDYTLSTSALSGVSLYEPEELVLRAGPGTPMSQLQLQLEQHGQMLAFEPPDYGTLLGNGEGLGTIGGIVATNLSGPRRIKAGAARDHFLGVEAVSGRGETFKSGGRVVKNVTGYDLCKLMCGSWGTLGVMTDLTLKVLPSPEKTRTVLVSSDDAGASVKAMTAALSSPNEVSAAAWMPADVASGSAVSYVSGAGAGIVALRVEGIGVSVEARCASLRDVLGDFGEVEELHTHNSHTLWREVRDVLPFAGEHSNAVWKVSLPPAAMPAALAAISSDVDARYYLDWGGGLAWIVAVGDQTSIRAAAASAGGHATLVRADEAMRRSVDVFQPEAPGVALLSRKIKEAFDPNGILNPGRMYEGV